MVNPETIITDMGSTKRKIMEVALAVFSDNVYFVGGHPMAGSEQSGIDYADPNIFIDKAYILVPRDNTPESVINKLKEMITTIGSFPVILTPEVHDEIVAVVSHLPQIASIALMNTVGSFDKNSGNYLKLAGGGLYDMTRIASSRFSIWKNICETNQSYIKKAISVYIKKLEEIKELSGNEDLEDEFEQANKLREMFNEVKNKEF